MRNLVRSETVNILECSLQQFFQALVYCGIIKHVSVHVFDRIPPRATGPECIFHLNETVFQNIIRRCIKQGCIVIFLGMIFIGLALMHTKHEGLVTSVSSIGSGVGTGLGSAILGWGLAAGGYDGALAAQAQSALNAETFLLFIVPTIASAVCFVCMWFWDIDKYLKK